MSRTDQPSSRRDGRGAGHDDRGSHPGHHHYTPEELHNEDVAHEESDVNIRAVLLFALGLAVVTATAAVLMYGLFHVFERQAAASDRVQSPLAVPATNMPRTTTASPSFGAAPQPRLLTNEPGYLQRQRRTESEQLHGYGWIDQQAGVARIPIDEAKKLIVERKLPARTGAGEPGLGTHAAAYGEANGGRLISREGAASTATGDEPPAKAPAGSAAPPAPHRGGE